MAKKGKKQLSKKTIIGLAAAGVLLVGGVGTVGWMNHQSQEQTVTPTTYTYSEVKEGTIASSTLLSGTVKALSEQYVYYDSTKGENFTYNVAVGDQVVPGQQLVQYDATAAQQAYDQAVRSLNKIGREITFLKTYGVQASTVTSTDSETGETSSETVEPSASQIATYNNQLQELNDSYANAQIEVDKAQAALNKTVILSDVQGTVVEINHNVSPTSQTTQTLVHITSEGQLQVIGNLTEYEMANAKVGQEVKIKSKVYPNEEWTGKIAEISNYPTTDSSADSNAAAGSTATTTASYPYKIDITSALGSLRQGSAVSVEVVNQKTSLLVPLTSIVTEDDKSYVFVYDTKTTKVKKTEVTLGSADGTSQEIVSGLAAGDKVITVGDYVLQDGQSVEDVKSENGSDESSQAETTQATEATTKAPESTEAEVTNAQ
ncbi:efflux RND transporter periplasmic adaptor subunit [Streptococcus caprae]|uniref:Efflux RND transporter periplasmic adaptor subunit n=1 Tax=Streptococcus caprae TaxID=1640501 RepID=A0ABV8CYQ3_9STRE